MFHAVQNSEPQQHYKSRHMLCQCEINLYSCDEQIIFITSKNNIQTTIIFAQDLSDMQPARKGAKIWPLEKGLHAKGNCFVRLLRVCLTPVLAAPKVALTLKSVLGSSVHKNFVIVRQLFGPERRANGPNNRRCRHFFNRCKSFQPCFQQPGDHVAYLY